MKVCKAANSPFANSYAIYDSNVEIQYGKIQ